jgi:molybdate transport system substrate-binding protein
MRLRIFSGGAAQGLVDALAPEFETATGYRIDGTFGAVGAMGAKLRAGEGADIVILTEALIAELVREGFVIAGTEADLGVVQTAVAIRAGDEVPQIGDADALRAALRQADAIYFPDPQQATAGIHFASVLERLGVRREVEARLKTFPNGATAMRELARAPSARPIGCTQATEILSTPGVALVGPLPEGCALATVYTAAVCTDAVDHAAARKFVALLAGAEARERRERAGFISARGAG